MCSPAILVPAMIGATLFSANTQKQAASSEAAVIKQSAENNQKVAEYNAQGVENAGKYNADVLEGNAKIFDTAAEDAITRGADAAYDERQAAKKSNSRGRAIMGSSGTVADSGTNAVLLGQNRQQGEINALTAMNNAEREAYGYKVEATDARARAKGVKYQSELEAGSIRAGGQVGVSNANYYADSVKYGGNLNAASTLITGVTNSGKYLFDNWGSLGKRKA